MWRKLPIELQTHIFTFTDLKTCYYHHQHKAFGVLLDNMFHNDDIKTYDFFIQIADEDNMELLLYIVKYHEEYWEHIAPGFARILCFQNKLGFLCRMYERKIGDDLIEYGRLAKKYNIHPILIDLCCFPNVQNTYIN